MQNTAEWLSRIIDNPKPDFNQLLKVLTRSGLPDFVPHYELFLNMEFMEAILNKKLPDRASTVEFYYKAGYDYVPVWPKFKYESGSLVDTTSHYPIQDEQSFESYQWPEPERVDYTDFELVNSLLPNGMKMIGQTIGVFEMAETLMGYNMLCLMLHDDIKLVERIFDKIALFYVAMYERMAAAGGIGALVISDDMGFNTQTLISVDHLRALVLPIHKRLADIAHRHNLPCILHSCGQVDAIMEDIIGYVGIDAKHSYQDQIMPVTEVYRKYGKRIAILGGIDVDRLCRDSEAEIRSYTRELITQLGHQGGYAVGSGNSIPGYIPIQNYMAMIETAWNMR